MSKKMSNFMFWGMKNIGMPIRNVLMPPDRKLDEVNIKKGDCVLDYGCGPGIFTKRIFEKAGNTGNVYALDIHPNALKAVEALAKNTGMTNVKTILSDGKTQLSDDSVDVVIMFDVLHMLDNADHVFKEMQRILKPNGMLYLSDHHMRTEDIKASVPEAFDLSQLYILPRMHILQSRK